MIAIFYATRMEGAGLLKEFVLEEEIRRKKWQFSKHWGVVRKGKYQNREVILAQTGIQVTAGVGNLQAKEVAECVFEHYSPKQVVIVGTCGAKEESIEPGDLIICSPVCTVVGERNPLFPDTNLCSLANETLEKRKMRFHTGQNLTIPLFSWHLESGEEIAVRYPEAWVVDMEDYFIASVAISKKIPWIALRMVSDTLKEVNAFPPKVRNEKAKEKIAERCQGMEAVLYNEFLSSFLQGL